MSSTISIGRIHRIWRYPVKSMAGESLEAVDVSWNGLAGDRRWAFVRADVPSSGFPWLTIRQRPEMGLYRPWFAEPDRPNASATLVRTPDGRELNVLDPRLAEGLATGCHVMKQDRGIFDTLPLSLLTTGTVSGLSELLGTELDPRRFRSNLFVMTAEGVAFPEEEWVGRMLRIGDVLVRVNKRDKRCVIVNVDPDTADSNVPVLRTVTTERAACAGVYGSVVEPGSIAVGDEVYFVD